MNVKRILSCVLALALAASLLPGLVSAPAAASFSDIADDATAENVEVLRMLGVVDGVGNGAFRPGGTLTRAAQTDALGATLTVEDTGGGIDPADLPRLFERFYTARSRRGDAADHAGIGLALARSILTRQGGTLTAANIPGGARFTFWFPRLTV